MKRGDRKYFIPITDPVNFEQSQELPIDPYILGILLGDGSFMKRRVILTTADDEILSSVKEYASQKGLRLTQGCGRKYDYGIVGEVGNKNNWMTETIVRLGLHKKYSEEKFIPEPYKIASISNRIAILQGLFDTDGTISKRGGFEYSTSSPQLSEDVRFIAQSLGCRVTTNSRIPHYTYKGKKLEGKLNYRIRISFPPWLIPFRILRKAMRYVPKTKYPPHRSIEKIEYIGMKEAQCLQTDAQDGLYLTDEFIATHNTRLMLRLMLTIAKLQKRNINLKSDIYYLDISGLEDEIMTKEKLIRGLDEAYFSMFNLDTNTTAVKYTTQAMTATRNRGHVIIINLAKLTRGAKPILEIATYWFHKPNLEYAILLCRDRELVGDDPWVVEPLMKAKTLGRKRWLLRHNPNYVATMKVKPLPQKLFDEYEAIKRSEQVKHAQAKRALQDSEERSRLLMQDWYKDYKENAFTIESMKFYITKTYHVPSLYADRYVSKFRSYLIDQELSEAVTEKHKQAAEE